MNERKAILAILIVVVAALCAGGIKQIREINRLTEHEEFDPRHPILKDWEKLMRLQTGKSNCVEVAFGPGTYGAIELRSEATNTLFILHGDYRDGVHHTVLTNWMSLDWISNGGSNNYYMIRGFMFDRSQITNSYAAIKLL